MSTQKQENKGADRGLPSAQPLKITDLAAYSEGAVVSRALVQSKPGSITLFAFDAGQGLNEHTTPYDAYVLVLEGSASITIAGKPSPCRQGEIVRMPANVPHAVDAPEPFKMLLLMIRD